MIITKHKIGLGCFTGKETTSEIFPATVDYDTTLEDLIRAGAYNWFNPDISSIHFFANGKGQVNFPLHLVHFGKKLGLEEIHLALEVQNLRPADAHELCTLGERYPELQRRFPIVAFGSIWHYRTAHGAALCLYGDSGARYLGLKWLGREFPSRYRFATVPK